MQHGIPDKHLVCSLLTRNGYGYCPDQITLERRDDKLLAHLPDHRLAWFALNTAGQERLETERRVLKLLEERCAFLAPRILFEGENGAFDVRSMVAGTVDPMLLVQKASRSDEISESLGGSIGRMLADQHLHVRKEDVTPWIRRRPEWPASKEWIGERLPDVVQDERLIRDAMDTMEEYEGLRIPGCEEALVHTEMGFHNMVVDLDTFQALGAFDYGDSAWADIHHDFRYLIYYHDNYALLNAAVAAYQEEGGRRISMERVLLYNAACAIMFLAYRKGCKPEDVSCGRTLPEDIGWTRDAMDKVLHHGAFHPAPPDRAPMRG